MSAQRLAPCPFCDAPTVKGWVESRVSTITYWTQHGEPVCGLGSLRQQVFPLTATEAAAVKTWPVTVITPPK